MAWTFFNFLAHALHVKPQKCRMPVPDRVLPQFFLIIFSYTRAVAAQIILTTRRVNTAGSINATHTEASKAEEDFRKLQEQKKAQDLYLNKLIKDQEDLDQKALDYQAQADAMLQQSDEIMNIVSTQRARKIKKIQAKNS